MLERFEMPQVNASSNRIVLIHHINNRLGYRLLLGVVGMSAFTACVTNSASNGNRAVAAANGCYDAANGQMPAGPGAALCNAALAAPGLPNTLHAATLVNRGVLHMKVNAHAAAMADYDAAIAEMPNLADAYINKGILLVQIGNRDAEAVAVLTAALDHNPGKPELVYYHRANAYEALGRLRDAYDDYAEAAQIAPGWAEPITQLRRFKFVRRKTMSG